MPMSQSLPHGTISKKLVHKSMDTRTSQNQDGPIKPIHRYIEGNEMLPLGDNWYELLGN